MKLLFGNQYRLTALVMLVALLSGPIAVASVWLVAAIAAEAGFVVLPDGAPRFAGPKGREGDVTEIVASRDQTGGLLGLFRQTIAPKSGPPTHIHQTEDEFFYVVSGEFKVKLGDRIMSAPAQTVMFVPRGTAHTFQNVGTSPGVILVGVTPGGFEKIMEDRQGVDGETLRALAKKYHQEVVGPPIQ
jgi:mannose-6-phosphate isomerase-like protein (cupin superfamily)